MASFNEVTLLGNVGKDPEIRQVGSNNVASFSLATTSFGKDNEKVTQWHNIVAWGNLADVIGKYARKGSTLLVNGELRYRNYKTQDGQQRSITEILAWKVQLVGGRPGQAESQEEERDLPF